LLLDTTAFRAKSPKCVEWLLRIKLLLPLLPLSVASNLFF
jgi:hypothetical protein